MCVCVCVCVFLFFCFCMRRIKCECVVEIGASTGAQLNRLLVSVTGHYLLDFLEFLALGLWEVHVHKDKGTARYCRVQEKGTARPNGFCSPTCTANGAEAADACSAETWREEGPQRLNDVLQRSGAALVLLALWLCVAMGVTQVRQRLEQRVFLPATKTIPNRPACGVCVYREASGSSTLRRGLMSN